MSSSPKQRATVGLLEWFRVGEYEQVERALDELDGLRAKHLRTGISWADFLRPGGREWYDWLLPKLADRAELLPCVSYTPPSLGEMPGTNAPPKRLEDYADFVAYLIELYGEHFEWVELWNEPDNHREWNAAFDNDYAKFAQMAGNAAKWAKHFGKKTLLGGLANADPNFLSLLHDHGALQHFDAVGVHGFPFSFEHYWEGWQTRVRRVRERLDWCGRADCEVWITETGYSTWRHDDRKQISTFLDAIEAPADRVYWYSLVDLHPDLPTVDGFHSDEREYHFGLKTADGNDKLLGRLWKTYGLDGIKPYADLIRNKSTHAPPGGEAALAAGFGDAPRAGDPAAKAASPARGETSAQRQRHTLVTGGAGFVGTNVADRVCREGGRVTILDNLSRPGVEANAVWLKQTHGDRVRIVCTDLLDEHAVRDATRGAEAVYHFAAQVAVTTSLDAPVHDFLANARGTINVLEAVRRQSDPPPLIFTSTNKVYGDLGDVDLKLVDGRWSPADPILRRRGIGEGRPLDFHSPYGCSKGSADQYVLDYARTYNLPTCVLRMSCIYGPHQLGTEDQGWVAHFVRAALRGEAITLYGDGRQVRDVLFVDDLVDAMRLAVKRIARVRGEAFNVGGGPAHAVSLLDVLSCVSNHLDRDVATDFGDWRVGDQKYYVSDTSKLEQAVGWRPRVSPADGIGRLYEWLRDAAGTAKPEEHESARI